LYYALDACGYARREQCLRRARVHSFKCLFPVLTQDADGINDGIDTSQFRQPCSRVDVAREVRIDGGGRVFGAPPGFDHSMPCSSQRSGQSTTNEAAGTGDQDVHA
jgi:hypothetical protein